MRGAPEAIGQRYVLGRQIGQGGMGAVWLAVDQVLGREVAVKRIGAFPGGDTPGLVRAQREAMLAARLNHPHVVAVFDFVTEGEEQWLVMEHVGGTDLASLVEDDGGLRPDEAARLLGQVAQALTAAHQAGIVHRDVKPSNILVTPEGNAKLADFGIARARDSTVTASGLVTGSPAYLAPEVAAGQPATEASDVWSLGATLYQALSGEPPYDTSDNVLSAMYRIVHEPPPRLPDMGWPAPLLETTMATDPADRWPMRRVHDYLTAGPASTDHDEAPTAVLQSAVLPAGPGPDPGSGLEAAIEDEDQRRSSLLPIVAVIVVALLGAAVAWWVLRPDPSPTAGEEPAGTSSTEGSPSREASPTTSSPAPSATRSASAPAPEPSTADTPTSSAPTSSATTASPPAPNQAQAMRTFVQQYVATALADPTSSWELLSPRFQQACCDGSVDGYAGYWNTIDDATLSDVAADPAAMQVSYVITWDPAGRPTEDENVTLGLVRQAGRYLIDYEL